MACFKWEVELEVVGRNKPCDASHMECVGRFEVTLEVHGLPPFLSHLLFMTRYHCVSGVDFLSLLIFINPKAVCFLLKCIFLSQEYQIIFS